MDIPPQIILVTVEIGRHLGAPNVTLNMLIGLEGVLYANTEDGATDTLAFLNFFDEASQNSMPNGQPILQYGDHVILDNCATHHFEGGYALAESLDNIGVEPTNRKVRDRTLSLVYSSASACDSNNAVFT